MTVKMEPKIVTFATEEYIPLAHNWIAAIESAAVRAPVCIVALDAATRDAFPAELVLYRPHETKNLGEFWTFRVRILRELLEEAPGLIHSDLDAIWIRNPLPIIVQCKAKMVFSQGTIWPPDMHAKHHIVVCCGFFYIENTAVVRGFMKRLEAQVSLDFDDQVSMNRLLDAVGVEWKVEEPYTISFRKKSFIASRKIIRSSKDSDFSVAILPHHLFPRVMKYPSQKAMVAHPVSPKTYEDKVSCLSHLGLWRLAK